MVASVEKENQRLVFEVMRDKINGFDWIVGAVNDAGDGEIYTATFSGPNAKERAEEYARWKNGQVIDSANTPRR